MDDLLRFTAYKRIAKNVEEAYAIIKGMNLADGQPVVVPFYYYDTMDRENGHGTTKIKIAFGIGGPDATQPYISTNISADDLLERIKAMFVTWEKFSTNELTVGGRDINGIFDDSSINISGVDFGSLNFNDHPELFIDASHIKSSANLHDILTALLTKVCGVHVITPKVDASYMVEIGDSSVALDNNIILPIGETVTIYPSYVYSQGKFLGEGGYDYDVPTGCDEDENLSPMITIYADGSTVMSVTGVEPFEFDVPDTSAEIKIGIKAFHEESIVPVDNFGAELDDLQIERGYTDEYILPLKFGYRVYKGALDDDSIHSVETILSANWNTIVDNGEMVESGESMDIVKKFDEVVSHGFGYYIAVPGYIEVNEICSPFGGLCSIASDKIRGSVTIKSKNYDVYLMPYITGHPVHFTNITAIHK